MRCNQRTNRLSHSRPYDIMTASIASPSLARLRQHAGCKNPGDWHHELTPECPKDKRRRRALHFHIVIFDISDLIYKINSFLDEWLPQPVLVPFPTSCCPETIMSRLPDHLDIHLIRILYLLLCEKNVSRVALKLNQPQPSISASLRKLRELTGDPLLVRGARGMVPTQHGESLLKPAKRILEEAESLFIKKAPFLPQEAAPTFHIAAPDYLDSQFLPNVVAALRRGSPNSRVIIHSLGPGVDYLRMLSDGDMDLVIANWDEPPPHLHISKLFEDPIACTMRADAPYARRTAVDAMTVEDYLSLPHVAPSQMVPG